MFATMMESMSTSMNLASSVYSDAATGEDASNVEVNNQSNNQNGMQGIEEFARLIDSGMNSDNFLNAPPKSLISTDRPKLCRTFITY